MVLSGPTNFSPILKYILGEINIKDPLQYHVILMITDGLITDFDRTIDTIVELS